ncbi:phospholipase A-2-activating protein-like isoform X1 [Mytilus edulis]|uniref:phospholipase A-2-activating protein-like isoform X1 n=2 Tax=Mytilus edulis TaxID=6550 RepID=UPI0039EE8353
MATSYKLRCCVTGHEKDVRALTALAIPDDSFLSGSRDVTAKVWVPNESDNGFHEGHVMSGHSNFISSVCYMPPDETYPQGIILTGSNDSTILAFTLNSPAPIYKLEGHTENVCALTAGKFGTLLSGSWDKTARVWLKQKCVMKLEGHQAAVWGVGIMPEHGYMLTGSADRTIKLWKAGRCEKTFTGHEDCVRGIAVLGSGEFLSCSNDSTIRRWAITGDCLQIYYGHENFVYSISILPNGQDFVSSSEDRTVRVWRDGTCVQTIPHPTMSVWTVCVLGNGDIASGASDGAIRVFTTEGSRVANTEELTAFDTAVATAEVPTQVGDIKMSDLPGPEALLNPGKKDGQTKMVKTDEGKVELYHWEASATQWKKIGDVVGSSGGSQATSGKALHDGKEYDYVFSVDIEEGKPPLKLPYDIKEDPWFAAQRFLQNNELSPLFLDQVANFIIDNTKGVTLGQGPPQVSDPFTGGGRYVPQGAAGTGTTGGADPLTGSGRYVPGQTNTKGPASNGVDPFTGASSYHTKGTGTTASKDNSYFPLKTFVTFETANPQQIIGKLKEFNIKIDQSMQVEESDLEKLPSLMDGTSTDTLNTLEKMLSWPNDMVFPALDVLRMCVLTSLNKIVCEKDGLVDKLVNFISSDVAPTQMLALRTLCNMFKGQTGEKMCVKHRDFILTSALNCKASTNKNIVIALATLLMNYSVHLQDKLDPEAKSQCLIAAGNVLENTNIDSEAGFRLLVCIGTLIDSDPNMKELARSINAKTVIFPLKKRAEPQKLIDCATFVFNVL